MDTPAGPEAQGEPSGPATNNMLATQDTATLPETPGLPESPLEDFVDSPTNQHPQDSAELPEDDSLPEPLLENHVNLPAPSYQDDAITTEPSISGAETQDTGSESEDEEEKEGPMQPMYMGWTLAEWAVFYASFSLPAWAAWSAQNGYSPWSYREWLEFYNNEPHMADPMFWARWACGLE